MDTVAAAKDIRIETLRMLNRAKASHAGGNLSQADILAVLYGDGIDVQAGNPKWRFRDRFILSKGHCCASLYATLALCGFFKASELETFGRDGSRLMSHASAAVPGVEFSTGSLGHGLPYGCGLALHAKRTNQNWSVYVLMSDGELNEGSVWESVMFAAHHKLTNLMVIVDNNGYQGMGECETVLRNDTVWEKFRSFGWASLPCDGHDHDALRTQLQQLHGSGPACLIANTVKGKGVSFMEGDNAWHYKSPNDEQLTAALKELQ